jgi:hypothetical protein
VMCIAVTQLDAIEVGDKDVGGGRGDAHRARLT